MYNGDHPTNMDTDLEAAQNLLNLNAVQSEKSTPQLLATDASARITAASERVTEAFASLNPPVTDNLPSNYEIIQELVHALERQYRIRSYSIMPSALLLIVGGIICFFIGNYVLEVTSFVVWIIFGSIFAFTGLVLFGFALMKLFSREPQTVAQGSVRYVMRINGEQWKRFVTYFYRTAVRPCGVRCWWFCGQQHRQRYQRLLQRNHGHIVFGSLGFMVDELFCTTYDTHTVLNVELLSMIASTNNENEVIPDRVMRVWLRRRVYNAQWGTHIPFPIDIFLASELPSYEIPNIVSCVAMR